MSWTDERIETLKKLWADGLSASQIANELGGGVSRNAVIGKIHRLGLSGRVKTPKARAARRAQQVPRPAPQQPPQPRVMAVGSTVVKLVEPIVARQPQPAPEADIVPLRAGLSLLDLGTSSCRWPVGDPSDDNFGFCGHAVCGGSIYCAAHAEVAYPARRKKK